MVGGTSASGVIGFDMLFKLRQHRHQADHFPLSAGVSRNRIEFRSHFSGTMPVLTQVVRQNGRRNTKPGIFAAFRHQCQGSQQQFTRIDKVLLAGITVKTVPAAPSSKLKTPLAGNRLGRIILPPATRHQPAE